MLSSRFLQEKTFEELIQDARNQIPLYTREWTNFNPSDPAVTVLENLSAFTVLQQAYTDRLPEEVLEKLFAMVGFSRSRGRSARVLLSAAGVEEPVLIPSGQRFLVGDLFFETNREFALTGSRLAGVFGKHQEKIEDYSYVLDPDIPLSAPIFTKTPEPGMELYLVMDSLGTEAGEALGGPGTDLIFHARLGQVGQGGQAQYSPQNPGYPEYHRNPFEGNNLFAELQWQCYTKKGFINIRCRDNTGSFLSSGELRFRLPKQELAVYEDLPVKGYVIRGRLIRADYDIPPRLAALSGFLFEVWQKETHSICYTFGKGMSGQKRSGKKASEQKVSEQKALEAATSGQMLLEQTMEKRERSGNTTEIEVYCDLLEEGYFSLFCREDGESSYRKYEEAETERYDGAETEKTEGQKAGSRNQKQGRYGRYYEVERLDYGRYRFRFDEDTYGYGPGAYDNAVKLVAYGEDMMRQFRLGQVYGYDRQEMKLPVQNIVRESFSVIAERVLPDGGVIYDFVKPESGREEEFRYRLSEAEGVIQIQEAADFIDARLYLCSCATTRGEEGNIRSRSRFQPVGYETEISFSNPAAGSGGRLLESLEEVRKRFLKDQNVHYTAVEAVDYEAIVRTTPELCIHKVKAVMDSGKNQVNVAVKPYSDQPFPTLSPIYREAILRRLEERRLLTTCVTLQQPVYVAVQIRGTIYVKPHFEGCREQIEAVLRQELDYIYSDRNFGDRLNFDELFHRIEALGCVDFIYELSAIPQNNLHASLQGLDIQPDDNCLLYPGDLELELNTLE